MTTIEWVRGSDGSDGMSWNALRALRILYDGEKMIPVSANHCERVNGACQNCYADSMNRRLRGLPFKPGHRKDYLAFVVDEEKLREPLKRKKPTRIFVESMSDAFGEWWPDEFIDKLYAVMALTPQHTYINLSKRPERRRQYLDDPLRHNTIELAAETIIRGPEQFGGKHVLPRLPFKNVIEGTSVSNQDEANEFVPILLRTKAAVRCLSCEPLLGPIDLHPWMLGWGGGEVAHCENCGHGHGFTRCPNTGGIAKTARRNGVTCAEFRRKAGWGGLDWVIVGGESGRKARPMHPDWARPILKQCEAARVAFFFKQWGAWAPSTPEHASGNPRSGWQTIRAHPCVAKAHELTPEAGAAFVEHVGKKAAGRLLDGREHNDFPRIAA